ncbi:MAG: DUF3311 domain-containing protein [Gemmatimonadaceae bacterium]
MNDEPVIEAVDVPGRGQQWRAYHWLAVLPTVGMLGGIPFANRVYPFVLGLPFLFAWLVGWVIATSAIMGLILVLDRANDAAHDMNS